MGGKVRLLNNGAGTVRLLSWRETRKTWSTQADWQLGTVLPQADTVSVPGSVALARQNLALWSPSLEACAGRVVGDPNLSNGQNKAMLGGDWYAAMHYAPAIEWGEVMTDGGVHGQKYFRWYESGSGVWKGLVGNTTIKNLQPGKWYRASVYVRKSVAGQYARCYFLYSGNHSGVRITGDTLINVANQWVRIVKTFRVPTDWDPAIHSAQPYLYGTGNATPVPHYTDWDGYMLEGPFDSDPGTVNVPPLSLYYFPTAVWQSGSIDLSPVKRAATAVISWTADEPPGTSVLVEASVDGGQTWQQCINGGQIPDINVGDDLTGKQMLVRVTLSTTDTTVTPTLHSLDVRVIGDMRPGPETGRVRLIGSGAGRVRLLRG